MDDPLKKAHALVDRLKDAGEHLQRAEERARQLLTVAPAAPTFVGVAGVELAAPHFELLPGLLSIRVVSNPPGIIHVCRAADVSGTDYLSVARYSSGVRAEIAAGALSVNAADKADLESILGMAWHAAALLKLRGQLNMVCPAYTAASWDTVAAYKEQRLTFGMLDDVPRRIFVRDVTAVSAADARWVADHYDAAFDLRDYATSRRFGLAFNLSYTWNHTADVRNALANVWCGLEALFGNRRDGRVTQALVERISAWLPGTDKATVRDLYDRRCDAVHGRWVEDDVLLKAAVNTSRLLNMALTRAIETKTHTLPDWEPTA